jgi:hypothetical protein
VIPNITRGGSIGGVLAYLVGPGRAGSEEPHVEPHLVAGSSAVMAWHADAELDRSAAMEIARDLDQPRAVSGVRVTQPVYEYTDDGGREKVGDKDADVWHCSLSLAPEEAPLSDERWAHISEQLVERMGFSDPEGGRAPCRWVAVRHGLSPGGNDHIHVVLSLVHEDRAKADVHHDRGRAQRVAGELEHEHGLQVLESRSVGRGTAGYDRVDRERAKRQSEPEPARTSLARVVRGCAAAAGDEAEFVRRLHRAGLRVRPRYAAGRGDVVAGYSVAQRPPRQGQSTSAAPEGASGAQPIWYGGGRLARDLSLPRLRAEWPDTPATASAAVAEWHARDREQPPVSHGREAAEPDPALWAQCTEELGALREQLRLLDPHDHAGWALAAKDAAGAFAAWSNQVEDVPGPLAAAADSLARSAQLRTGDIAPRPAGAPSAKGAALVLSSIAHQGQGTVAQAALLRQLANTGKALHDAHAATGDARRAREIRTVMQGQVAELHASFPQPAEAAKGAPVADVQAVEAARLAHTGQPPPRTPGSPLPAPLDESSPKPRPNVPGRENDMQR